MPEQLTPWTPDVKLTSEVVHIDDLRIEFHRTLRMPDNKSTGDLPPSMGHFPLFETKKYLNSLPHSMAAKGGLFFPMYQREAMYISFSSRHTYAIKIYVGGVNAVSGEPLVETAATLLRRRTRLSREQNLQDYVVAPYQLWLDGLAVEPGKVRQFVAMPMHSGHAVELQVTGEETTGGLQFEVTRLDFPGSQKTMTLFIQNSKGKIKSLLVFQGSTVRMVKELISSVQGTSIDNQRFVFGGQQLEDGQTLAYYKICDGSMIHLIARLYGGGQALPSEMSLAAGGFIKQNIVPLPQHTGYRKTTTTTFHVQILNSASFQAVTGRPAPPTPVSAEDYAANDLPFFVLYEEPSTLAGDFSGVRSVADIDGLAEASLGKVPLVNVKNGCYVTDGNKSGKESNTPLDPASIGITDMQAHPAPLRFYWELAEEINQNENLF